MYVLHISLAQGRSIVYLFVSLCFLSHLHFILVNCFAQMLAFTFIISILFPSESLFSVSPGSGQILDMNIKQGDKEARLSYKGTIFHRVINRFMLQGRNHLLYCSIHNLAPLNRFYTITHWHCQALRTYIRW